MKRFTLGALLAVFGLVACAPPLQNPATQPGPGDNQMKIEVQASQTRKNGVSIITENIRVKVSAVNGDGIALIGDDFKPLTNWDSGLTSTIPGKPWSMVLSQPAGEGGNAIIASFQIYPQSNKVEPRAVDITCHFFIKRVGETKWTEDRPKIQVGTGPKVTCLYSIHFPK